MSKTLILGGLPKKEPCILALQGEEQGSFGLAIGLSRVANQLYADKLTRVICRVVHQAFFTAAEQCGRVMFCQRIAVLDAAW